MRFHSRFVRLAAFAFLFILIGIGAPESGAAQASQKLTLREAEERALENHPQIQAAQLTALAVRQTITEARSAYYPFSFGSLTAAEADHNSRIAAGALNNPVIYNRYANGITVGQLINDFGRTRNLVQSSGFNAQAEQQNADAKREDVILQVDQAYFALLRSQAILRVAQETVSTRQVLVEQVTALAQSNLKSGLDVSFATVNLGQAKLLLSQAQNNVQADIANLSMAMGYPSRQTLDLAEEPLAAPPPSDVAQLIADALRQRPDLHALESKEHAAERFATAERDLRLPNVSALGSAGLIPAGQNTLASRYAAAGININIPIFNGHLFSARWEEAKLRQQAQIQDLRDLRDRISRDVTVAWEDANTAYQRLDLTGQLLTQASEALDLAQARYNLGLSSIVELSQAQLNKTDAEIQQTSARYSYQALMRTLSFLTGSLH